MILIHCGAIMSENNQREKKFEYFEVTADIGFYAYGNTLEEAYENAALAMFNVVTDIDNVKTSETREFEVESEDLVSLLYDYLDEFLFLQDTEFLFFSEFKVDIDKTEDGYKLNCIASGEEINWDVHVPRSEVKAITFHKMCVKKEDGVFKLRAILDL